MTKKHFEAIARDINMSVRDARKEIEMRPNSEVFDRLYVVACDLAATFSTFNANFSRTQFLTACGF